MKLESLKPASVLVEDKVLEEAVRLQEDIKELNQDLVIQEK